MSQSFAKFLKYETQSFQSNGHTCKDPEHKGNKEIPHNTLGYIVLNQGQKCYGCTVAYYNKIEGKGGSHA
jgi:hypothetical protein